MKKYRSNKRDRNDNSSWTRAKARPNSKGSDNKENVCRMRCDTTEDSGFKSSFVVDVDLTQRSLSREEMAQRMGGVAEKSYRPLRSVTFNPLGSPLFGETPGGTKLPRDKRYGALHVFSNRERYEDSAQCKQVEELLLAIKTQHVEVTEDQQADVRREKQKNGTKRKISQNRVMKESANDHVTRHSLFISGVRFEWAHLLAHSLMGAIAQNQDNLVATTSHANTDMIFVESDLPLLSKRYPNGFDVHVTAQVLAGTNVAQSIAYTISTPDFETTYQFDAQTTEKPHIAFKQYFHCLMSAFVSNTDTSSPVIATRTRSRMVDPNTNFFSRSEEVKKARVDAGDEDSSTVSRKIDF